MGRHRNRNGVRVVDHPDFANNVVIERMLKESRHRKLMEMEAKQRMNTLMVQKEGLQAFNWNLAEDDLFPGFESDKVVSGLVERDLRVVTEFSTWKPTKDDPKEIFFDSVSNVKKNANFLKEIQSELMRLMKEDAMDKDDNTRDMIMMTLSMWYCKGPASWCVHHPESGTWIMGYNRESATSVVNDIVDFIKHVEASDVYKVVLMCPKEDRPISA